MGSFLAACMAYFLNSYGIMIFLEAKDVKGGPLLSSYIFMFSLFILLWHQRVYPKSLRKLIWPSVTIIEFLACQFVMENIIMAFWFPLETTLMRSLPKLADFLCEVLQEANWTCDNIIEFLKSENSACTLSYFLSCFFLLCSLHATRSIDLRKLRDGIVPFAQDISNKLRRFYCKTVKGSQFENSRRHSPPEDDRCSCLASEIYDYDFCPFLRPSPTTD